MKTYWDCTKQERAALTEEQVKLLLDVELMTKGVKRPVPPVLAEIPKCPLGERQPFYAVSGKSKYGSSERIGPVFKTMEDAAKFMELSPYTYDYDYEIGSEFQYVKLVTEMSVEKVELYSLDQINQFRSEMKSRHAKKESNDKAQSEYNKASAQAEKVTSGVWSDWRRWLLERNEAKGIVSTLEEYTKLAGGDRAVAMQFLAKTYTAEQLSTARDWFPGELKD